jgi:hypothetical protein
MTRIKKSINTLKSIIIISLAAAPFLASATTINKDMKEVNTSQTAGMRKIIGSYPNHLLVKGTLNASSMSQTNFLASSMSAGTETVSLRSS